MKRHKRTSLFLALCYSAACCAATGTLEELKPQATEVAPGVYRLRAGEPEAIVPSLVRRPAETAALAAMPKASAPPLTGIKVWRLARGIRIELPLRTDEVIYGLGLQCKHLEQNGWRRTLYTASGDDNGAGMSHAPVPFYVSTAGYGVLVDSARCVTFSVGEEQRLADISSLAPEGGKQKIITDVATLYGPEKRNQTSVYVDVPAARGVDVYLFAGPQTGDAIARYNLYSGGGCLPSLSGLGPHYIFGAMLNASSVLALSGEIQQARIPVTTVGLEPGWETHAYSSSCLWNTNQFPPDFGVTIRERGYDLYLWCQLYIDPSSPLIPLLGARFGDFDVWHGLVPDLADPNARQIYGNFLADHFISRGVAGFKLDEVDGSPKTASAYQSWMFPDFTSFPSGADGDQLRNLLGRLGEQAISEAFRQQNRRTFGMVRADQAWSAPLPVALYSDEYNFGDYVRYNLSAGVQGLLWAPEIRNADDQRDWAMRIGAAAFSAKMIYNGWQFPHLIWQQPDLSASGANQLLPENNSYATLARHFNNLRMALLPYLYQTYSDYHDQGIPPVRPLVADWPEDANAWHLDDEWMLGADLLIAPLTDENAFSELYRVAFTGANQFQADSGVRMKFADGFLALDIADTHDGLPGASMEFDLKAGPCVARLLARGEIGRMAMRLRRVENDRETDVGELYKDDIPLDAGKWKELSYQFTVPANGHYRLLVGKAYFQRLPEPRRLELRDVSFEQRTGNPRQSWQRMVYLPTGGWRDFWTSAAVAGGQRLAVTATPEHPPVFVRDTTLLPLAEPVVTLDSNTVFNVHLAAYGENPQTCELREDDGTTFDYETGRWATITVHPDGTVDRPDHGQPQRYHIVGRAEAPAGLLNALLTKSPAPSAQTIRPGDIWPDDRGQHIDAHGGGILKLGDTYYWFGEDYARDNAPAKCFVSCYSSKDLSHWQFRNQVLVLTNVERMQPRWVVQRPKVYYNEKTKQFVMYFHLDGAMPGEKYGYNLARVGVAICGNVDGDYQYLKSFRPLGHESRDIGQFIDDDGTACLLSEDRPNGFHIYQLSDDYLSIAEDLCLIPEHLEGLALVHYEGLYYIVGSHLTSWAPNPDVYATAKSLAGPWSEFKDIAPPDAKTYCSQSTFLLKVSGTQATNVIFMGDIWKPDTQWDSRYLWMPLQIGDGKLWLPKPCDWTINVRTGEVTLLKTAHEVPEAELKQLPGVSLVSAGASYTTSSQYGAESGSGLLLDDQDGQDAFAFHTESESNASVVIDLKRAREIVGVTILNRADDRPDIEDRAASLAMWLSDDAVRWRCVWKAGAAEPIWRFELDQPQHARYVKLGLQDANFLHLKRVRIYGR